MNICFEYGYKIHQQNQFSSVVQSCQTLCNSMDCSTPGFPVFHCLPEFAQTHIHWVSDAIQPSHPLLPSSAPAFPLSQHPGIFQWVSSSHQIARVLEFELQYQSFQWIFRIDFLQDGLGFICLQSKGLESLLQNHSLKASILQHSFFFMVQLSHPYMTTGKTIALAIRTFSDKVMSLLFNILSRFVVGFLLRSKCLLNSWLHTVYNSQDMETT